MDTASITLALESPRTSFSETFLYQGLLDLILTLDAVPGRAFVQITYVVHLQVSVRRVSCRLKPNSYVIQDGAALQSIIAGPLIAS